ncbi:hypothetical protein JTE90_028913, partial [Oedothorax gibbosus]
MMDDLIDQIVVSGDNSNLPLLQTENEGKRQKKRKRAEMAGPKIVRGTLRRQAVVRENKRMMDDLIDQIVVSGDTSNLPLLQTENEGKRQKKRKRAEMAGPK